MEKIQFFSDKTNKFYQLVPTKTIPVLKINGVPMHRYATLDPLTDVRLKIRVIDPRGRVLDICTGLGYSAIHAARSSKVNSVTTIEKDEEVLRLAKLSPDSHELFTNEKISIINKDAAEAVSGFEDWGFDTILHDPPTFVISPELYSIEFYKELYRILKKGGKLAHYAPMPGKAKDINKAKKFLDRIITNLKKAGFKKIRHFEKETEILAFK